jgi:hypothetical protein
MEAKLGVYAEFESASYGRYSSHGTNLKCNGYATFAALMEADISSALEI